ncbi:aldo/keto reductase [Fervidobacterium pennivorans subsp. shakshaketiis]|jgi:voltage-dependent potassium channel beta subunit|uniref:Oxidoreductase, aryl-alcohol dehydrogenase like protein n=1 Tax=Fervidobacterium pennivorans (strain DSM 9078 / Ven5) TaxID=771875 RepID=H9UC78_FERPD|nr:aldo/keto reductase [Fervidobacterium pennivorans]AFG35121.1 putative oxidoreductase, aryl-alcohol dehydrogenase like protein [Fervidobacterium pennivorans DSM 9078]QIV78478.1 aldo/keto reductase [Fervidobacterium pennivorans subsp. keratinolyticus]
MEYRKVGKWGLKISEVSLGTWLTFGNQLDLKSTREVVRYAVSNGINFIDTAEAYANGIAESMLGMILKEYRREDLVISTKIFWGGDGPNDKGLSRKHLLEGTWNSLKRLQLDYVDILYCHRPDPEVPMEEVVWTMDQIVRSGLAFYWGTSEWSAEEIERAHQVAKELNCIPPVVEQPQYNLIFKDRVEKEYAPLYEKYGMGLTTWSPLASGVLTGKYLEGIPQGSRLDRWPWLKQVMEERGIFGEETTNKIKRLKQIADDLGVTMSQLSIAWCLKNPHVSSVILGVSSLEQLKENIKAVEVKDKITDEIYKELSSLF